MTATERELLQPQINKSKGSTIDSLSVIYKIEIVMTIIP